MLLLSLAEHTNLLRAIAVGVNDRLTNNCTDTHVLAKAFDLTFGKTMHVSLQLMMTDGILLNLSNLVDNACDHVLDKLMPVPEGNLGYALHSAAPFSCRAVLRSHAHEMILEERPACALCMPLCHDIHEELLCALLLASNRENEMREVFDAWSTWGPARNKVVGTLVITLAQPTAAHAQLIACNALLLSAIVGSSILQTSGPLLKAAAERAGICGTYVAGMGFVRHSPTRLGIAHLVAGGLSHSGEGMLIAGNVWDEGGMPTRLDDTHAATSVTTMVHHDECEDDTQVYSPDVPKQCGFRRESLGNDNQDDDPEAIASSHDSAGEGMDLGALSPCISGGDVASTSRLVASPATTEGKICSKDSGPLQVTQMWEDVRLLQNSQDLVYTSAAMETQYMLHEYGGEIPQIRHWVNVITCICMLWHLVSSSPPTTTLFSLFIQPTTLAMLLVTLGVLVAGIASILPSTYWRTRGCEHLLMASLCIHHMVCGPEFSRRGLLHLQTQGLPQQGLIALHVGAAAAAWATLHGLRYYRMRHVLMLRGMASMLWVSPLLCNTYLSHVPRGVGMAWCATVTTCAVVAAQWVCRVSEQQRRTAFKQAWLQQHGVAEHHVLDSSRDEVVC